MKLLGSCCSPSACKDVEFAFFLPRGKRGVQFVTLRMALLFRTGEYVTGDVTPEYLAKLEESSRVAKKDRAGTEKAVDLCGARCN